MRMLRTQNFAGETAAVGARAVNTPATGHPDPKMRVGMTIQLAVTNRQEEYFVGMHATPLARRPLQADVWLASSKRRQQCILHM